VWTDGMTVGWAKMALPNQIKLKYPSQFPHQKQYPLKSEGKMRPLTYHKFLKKTRAAN
jgi:hypothetical protein